MTCDSCTNAVFRIRLAVGYQMTGATNEIWPGSANRGGSRSARPEARRPMAGKSVSYIIVPVVCLLPANHKSASQHRAIKLELVAFAPGFLWLTGD
jgi:hypothetical protein